MRPTVDDASNGEDAPRSAEPRLIAGGITAHNDERHIERSIHSLLSQELPPNTAWGRIWVVASGCTDRTVEFARSVEAEEPRVGVVVERERRGKAAAIQEILRRAEGESLVLLNSDAVAAPGSVASLLVKAEGKPRPYAVMARPTVPATGSRGWTGTMRWMWDLHHEIHQEMLSDGRGAHLSDELLLVSLPAVPWIEEGVINDGSYCAVWLREHAGGCWYAPEAQVAIDIPRTRVDHLRQRRRIHVGNAQVAARLGKAPTTALRFFLQDPPRAVRALRRALGQEQGTHHMLRIAVWEVVSHALATWDRLPPRRDHVLWSRIGTRPALPRGASVAEFLLADPQKDLERRIRVILEVAREFGTGVSLTDLASLLPGGSVDRPDELERFLECRPELAEVGRQRAFSPNQTTLSDPERVGRGREYRRRATELIEGPLAFVRQSVRCVGVTGSAAYDEPLPGDDLDFFVITRRGALSWFLVATYVALRIRGLKCSEPSEPVPCFNYVVDERRAPREFAGGRGLLFAREALTARMILGDAYYRGLLARTPWLGEEIPRLYAARTIEPGETTPQVAPLLVRIASAMLFPALAAYLQLVGLRRNFQARRGRRESETFRTLTSPSRVAFQSRRFDQLRVRYETPGRSSPSSVGVAAPSRFPTAR